MFPLFLPGPPTIAIAGCSYNYSILLVLQVLLFLFVSEFIVERRRRRNGGLHKCELIGCGSPRH